MAFYVLDAVLDWPVAMYDASWSQWGQMSANTKGGQLDAGSPWQTDISSRSELVVYNSDTATGAVTFLGSGLDDLTTSGTYSGSSSVAFLIEIETAGTPDTFRWSTNGGTSWTASAVSITGAAQTLQDGMSITFSAATGHTVGDQWAFATGAKQAVELLTMDGSTCSGQRDTSDVDTYTPTGCISPPISYVGSANQVEEEDALYFGAGGGSNGGGGGGGPIVPGY